ncbi:hypothetical protein TERTU_4662 [Teredinibacter turnerae T7901]|uniref:Lipoprotein n=1 Tax=Teredinibacter turnerae (strain ATCC 39867 / T7901) TaxID=377629 RepID=C5BKE7_TERTT|nr:hypothetical protein [Teredinibacter turnerae]ACR13036.1 hypothetical protein TERTU_4662 [Teredinibacter turnerae T7901]
MTIKHLALACICACSPLAIGAQSTVKPGADVIAAGPQTFHVAVADVQTLVLPFAPARPGESLQLVLLKSNGLEVLSTSTQWVISEGDAPLELLVRASAPGQYRLQFLARSKTHEQQAESLSRVVGLMVVAGDGKSTSASVQKATSSPVTQRADGTRVISFSVPQNSH